MNRSSLLRAKNEARRFMAEERTDSWWTDPRNLALLFQSLLADCSNTDECRETVAHVLSRPWKWTAEFEAAKEGR